MSGWGDVLRRALGWLAAVTTSTPAPGRACLTMSAVSGAALSQAGNGGAATAVALNGTAVMELTNDECE